MIKHLLVVTLLVFALLPLTTTTQAQSQLQSTPGACAKVPVPTAQTATQAASAAASANNPTQPSANKGSGAIALSGAFALYPLAQKWGEEYNKLHSDVQFDIQAGGAGKGMTDVLAGAVDIGMLSRDLRAEEKAKGAVIFPVAIDAVLFTISADNPVAKEIQTKGLSCAALQRVFINGEKLTWGQLLGTNDSSPINVYTRADASGAAEQIAIYLGGKSQDDLKGIGVQGDPGLLEAVSKDPLGIGYNNISFAYDPSTGSPVQGLLIVPLDQNGSGTIEPAEAVYTTQKDITAAIAANKFPAPPARALYLVTKGTPQGNVKAFIQWALSDGQQFVGQAGYVKVAPEKLQSALDSLK